MPEIAPLAAELRLSIHRLTRRLRQQQPDDELTLTQMSALSVIWRNGPLTAGELATREQVRPPSITRVVDGLVGAGLVCRKDNPSDGRQVMVEITDLGVTRMEQHIRAREEWLVTQLRALSPADLEVLHRATVLLDDLALR